MTAKRTTTALLIGVLAAVLAALAGSVHAATNAGPTLTIWTDQNRKGVITDLTAQWVKKNPGVTFKVVVKTSAASATTSGRSTRRTRPT